MANINLGSIKFNWKGAYSGATAYVVDDVVESSGSSYICILATTGNAPPNATYWEQMSSAGTNGTDGTDLGTVLTTQGDLVYRDGSGLQRLGAGTSGQALITQGAGANPIWGTAGTILQVVSASDNTSYTQTGSGDTDCTNYNVSITPSSASNKILISMSFVHRATDGPSTGSHEARGVAHIRDVTNSSNIAELSNLDNYIANETRAQHIQILASRSLVYSPSTTSQITFSVRLSANAPYESVSFGNYQAVLMEIAG